jgi:hypothetical protein
METDADASGIHTWLFGFVIVILTTIQTHRFPTSLSRMGSPTRAAKLGIGPVDTKIGHSCTGTVRPRVISECGTTNNPRPLAYEACLKKTCADSASLDAMESASWHRKPSKSKKDQKLSEHFTWHCSVHPTGQQKEQCSAGFASGRSTISRYGVDCQSMHAFAPFAGAWLSAPVQQDDQKTGKGARAHPLL